MEDIRVVYLAIKAVTRVCPDKAPHQTVTNHTNSFVYFIHSYTTVCVTRSGNTALF